MRVSRASISRGFTGTGNGYPIAVSSCNAASVHVDTATSTRSAVGWRPVS
jgi:hypothetical protein